LSCYTASGCKINFLKLLENVIAFSSQLWIKQNKSLTDDTQL